MVNNPLIRPAICWGGGIGGVPLDSHELKNDHPMDLYTVVKGSMAIATPKFGGDLDTGP